MLILIMSARSVCVAESIVDDAIGDDSKEVLERFRISQLWLFFDICKDITHYQNNNGYYHINS